MCNETVNMRLHYQMTVDRRVVEQESALRTGDYEGRAVADCLQLVPDDGVMVDVGANIGFFTCAFACRRDRFRGHAYAVEPVSANREALEANVRLNEMEKSVTVVPCALGEREGVLTLHIEPEGATNNAVGDDMLTAHDRVNIEAAHWKEDSAPLRRLDDVARELRIARCDLMKMDVEGAELHVLRGGMAFIAAHRPAILGEFSPYWMQAAGLSFTDVTGLLEPLGYAAFIEREGRYVPVTEATVGRGVEVPTYLLLPAARMHMLEVLNDLRQPPNVEGAATP